MDVLKARPSVGPFPLFSSSLHLYYTDVVVNVSAATPNKVPSERHHPAAYRRRHLVLTPTRQKTEGPNLAFLLDLLLSAKENFFFLSFSLCYCCFFFTAPSPSSYLPALTYKRNFPWAYFDVLVPKKNSGKLAQLPYYGNSTLAHTHIFRYQE